MKLSAIFLLIILSIFLTGCGSDDSILSAENAPLISSFTPLSGIAGTQITVSGSNFSSNPATNQVTIGGVNVMPSSASATQLIIAVPDGLAPGDYRIAVKIGNFSSASIQQFTVK